MRIIARLLAAFMVLAASAAHAGAIRDAEVERTLKAIETALA